MSLRLSRGRPYSARRPAVTARHHSVHIRHREYVQDITSGDLDGNATGFKSNTFLVQPGLKDTFPWLSQLADSFETYRFVRVVYEFRSMSGVLSTSTSLGSVLLVAQYNSSNGAFADMISANNYEGAISVKPADSVTYVLQTNASLLPDVHRYIRTGGIPPGLDPRLYDLAIFQVISQGMPQANTFLGQLWVTYDIELFQPRVNPAVPNPMSLFSSYQGDPDEPLPNTDWFRDIGLPVNSTGFASPDLQPGGVVANASVILGTQGSNCVFPGSGNTVEANTVYFTDPSWAGKIVMVCQCWRASPQSTDYQKAPYLNIPATTTAITRYSGLSAGMQPAGAMPLTNPLQALCRAVVTDENAPPTYDTNGVMTMQYYKFAKIGDNVMINGVVQALTGAMFIAGLIFLTMSTDAILSFAVGDSYSVDLKMESSFALQTLSDIHDEL